MKTYLLVRMTLCGIAISLCCITSNAQKMHLGLFAGASAYNGDLVERILPEKETHAVLGLSVNYELSEHLMLRAGFSMTKLSGADKYNRDTVLVKRNLS